MRKFLQFSQFDEVRSSCKKINLGNLYQFLGSFARQLNNKINRLCHPLLTLSQTALATSVLSLIDSLTLIMPSCKTCAYQPQRPMMTSFLTSSLGHPVVGADLVSARYYGRSLTKTCGHFMIILSATKRIYFVSRSTF